MDTQTGRVVFLAQAGPRLTERQLQGALAVDADNLLYRAVTEIIDQELGTAVMEASDPHLVPGRGTFPGGKIEALSILRKRLEDYRTPPKEAAAAPSARKGRARR